MAREPGGTSRLHLQTLFSVGVTAALTDGQLLERFATLRGEAAELAFAALVERHGSMVFHACRGILKDEHEAHDAFQATFLVLLRKGNTLWVRDSLGPWLHRVACRAAVRARVEAQRRRVHERRAAEQAADRLGVATPGELAAVLHEEIDGLADRYRVPIVLCDLQGWTYAEAAQHLRCPIGTVRSRLARGRERLRRRLTRHGLAPSAVVLSATLAREASSAAIPATWVGFTIQYARRLLAGGALEVGEIPASVLAITEGGLKMFSLGKRTLIAASVLTAIGLVIGAGVLAQQATEPQPPPKPGAVAERDRRWIDTLESGATIEVIGVAGLPFGPNSWWTPDGTPLAEPPCDRPTVGSGLDRGGLSRAIVARISGVPEGTERWEIETQTPSGAQYWYEDGSRAGKPVPGLEVVVVKFTANPATCTVELVVEAGPWQTLGTFSGRNAGARDIDIENRNERFIFESYLYGKAVATRAGGTVLTVTHDISFAKRAVRLVAVDHEGKEHAGVDERGESDDSPGGGKGFQQLVTGFDLAPEAIREYRLQARGYERVQVPGIALKPNGAR